MIQGYNIFLVEESLDDLLREGLRKEQSLLPFRSVLSEEPVQNNLWTSDELDFLLSDIVLDIPSENVVTNVYHSDPIPAPIPTRSSSMNDASFTRARHVIDLSDDKDWEFVDARTKQKWNFREIKIDTRSGGIEKTRKRRNSRQ
jgi:hypothetical protein